LREDVFQLKLNVLVTRLPINVVCASRRNLLRRVRAGLDFLADAVKDDSHMGATPVQ
jgi:hypothetical protein